ncbi:hypothetical protein LTR74_018643, partial [Friedmanniomyces endolithicus]
MLIPTHIRLRYWFYPIGNTPAVDLLRHSPLSSRGRTSVLSLGCGDVRNVLFTLWTERATTERSYTFTTCDSEPAVLARNIFLLSFLTSYGPYSISPAETLKICWEFYYHLVISDKALAALQAHLVALLNSVRTIEDWQKSAYAAHLKFLSKSTLVEVAKFWRLYLNACIQETKGRHILEESRRLFSQRGFDGEGIFLHGGRCAGIHALSTRCSKALSDAFRGYWKTGVVAGNQSDVSALENCHGGFANPLFRLSSAPLANFAVHYGSDPLLGYHLAGVFDDTTASTSAMVEHLATGAKGQFVQWCENFRQHVQLKTMKLYFHCGEAVSLCYALQHKMCRHSSVAKSLHRYSRPWCATLLQLDAHAHLDACGPFDVIDTSNMSDHVGFLNLMPATVPLLGTKPTSVLYVETLLRSSNKTSEYLPTILHADIATFCLIAGVAPTIYLTGSTSESFASEAVLGHSKRDTGTMSQSRFRVAWQRPWTGGPSAVAQIDITSPTIAIDPGNMARVFFQWYLQIFSEFEDMTNQIFVHFRRVVNPLSRDLGHYTRMTIVSLIGLAQKNICRDWRSFTEALIDLFQRDQTLMVGSNSLQELCTLLHLSGMHTASMLDKTPFAAAQGFASAIACPAVSSIERYPTLPNVVAVALVVPRDSLRIFDPINIDRFGTPGLHMALHCSGIFENSFFSIHLCFGSLEVDEGQHVGIIKEDEKGWQGHSDLIAICLAPAFQFLIGRGADVHVALVLNSSVVDYHFVPILGPSMRVYDTSITDRQNLHLLRTLPGDTEGPASVLQEPPQRLERPKTIPLALCRDQSLNRLTIRTKFTDEIESRDLQNQELEVKIVQEGPCTMRITFGSHSRVLAFPFPVDGAYSKTRIAGRTSWIEVTVPLSSPTGSHGYNMWPFLLISAGGYLNCWGLGRVNLAKQPILPLSTARRYLSGFLGMTLSEAKHKTRQNPSAVTDSTRVLLELKESLAAIMLTFIGQGNKAKDVTRRYSAFRLAKDNDSDLLIFANSLRHDRDSGSVCLDAYVVPLTDNRIRQLASALRRAVSEQHLMSIRLSEDESVLWKRLIPALIERCRLRWSHGRNYLRVDLLDKLRTAMASYNQAKTQLDAVRTEQRLRVLKQANIIGLDTSGLARNLDLIRRTGAKVLLCEEAGEVLEAHLLTALLPSIEHAILIGDHQQLRPHVQNHNLSTESRSGAQYSLDVSLFERLVQPQDLLAQAVPFSILSVQR